LPLGLDVWKDKLFITVPRWSLDNDNIILLLVVPVIKSERSVYLRTSCLLHRSLSSDLRLRHEVNNENKMRMKIRTTLLVCWNRFMWLELFLKCTKTLAAVKT
jgi:hypothetical protein